MAAYVYKTNSTGCNDSYNCTCVLRRLVQKQKRCFCYVLIKYYLQMGCSHFLFGSATQPTRHGRAIGHFLHPASPRLMGRAAPCHYLYSRDVWKTIAKEDRVEIYVCNAGTRPNPLTMVGVGSHIPISFDSKISADVAQLPLPHLICSCLNGMNDLY